MEFWSRFGVRFLCGVALAIAVGMTAGVVASAGVLRWIGWWK